MWDHQVISVPTARPINACPIWLGNVEASCDLLTWDGTSAHKIGKFVFTGQQALECLEVNTGSRLEIVWSGYNVAAVRSEAKERVYFVTVISGQELFATDESLSESGLAFSGSPAPK
jgi:hypothetical protein